MKRTLTEAPFNYRRDNPGGEWLARKQAVAAEQMAENNGRGRHGKGTFGAATATVSNVLMPVSYLSHLGGVLDEDPKPGNGKFDRLLASFEENGYTQESEIIVWVNHLGQAWIAEGNNRVAIAKLKRVPAIRTTIYYFNGGEEADGLLKPEKVRSLVRQFDDHEAMKGRKKPRYGYHVARKRSDLSITSEGLRPDSRGNIYIWDSWEIAQWWAKREAKTHGEPMTVWAVDTTGLTVIPDPEAEDMSQWSAEFEPGMPGGGWVIQGQEVGPERVREW